MKRAFIIYDWDGHPNKSWLPWFKAELEKNSFQVYIPAMPESAKPKIEARVSHFYKIVGDIDKNTYFVGHSTGCQIILGYLERLPTDKKLLGERLGAKTEMDYVKGHLSGSDGVKELPVILEAIFSLGLVAKKLVSREDTAEYLKGREFLVLLSPLMYRYIIWQFGIQHTEDLGVILRNNQYGVQKLVFYRVVVKNSKKYNNWKSRR